MQCILLAAGYATRLRPLTDNMPKALLALGEGTILDMVVDKICEVDEIENIYIVTNHRFYMQFCDWAKKRGANSGKNIKVINDFTTSNENRLGAIGDLWYVIEKEHVDDDILVMASDNIFDFSLNDFAARMRETGSDMICAHPIQNPEELHSMGVVELDPDGKVLSFEEKPAEPKSNWGVPPFYLYKRETLPKVKQYLDEGNNPDAPGHFVPWLVEHGGVYAFCFDTMRIDIGTPESYYETVELVKSGKLFEKRI